jgi:hydroxymethylbilane synthase
MPIPIKIGTRDSALALWQATYIQNQLQSLGCTCELVLIKSDGELDTQSPLYEMGVQGIFTKTLDIALLQGKIDIAVHSLKDVPTQLAKGIVIAAIPERGNHKDILVFKDKQPHVDQPYLVATSSLRRSAQWLQRYNAHQTTVLRGNINTRLQKLYDHTHWDGALFAAAGVERIRLELPQFVELDWMIPAPAQGALCVAARAAHREVLDICALLNDDTTFLATSLERQFLRALMGGCSMPIGAHAEINNDTIYFRGCVLTIDGKQKAEVLLEKHISDKDELVKSAIEILYSKGGKDIIETFKKQ